jgi:hypothetical protein
VTRLAQWIDIEQPPTGLRLESLHNSGHTPDSASPHPFRVLSDYVMNWWASPGTGSAIAMLSWKPDVQDAFARFSSQVIVVVPFTAGANIVVARLQQVPAGSRSQPFNMMTKGRVPQKRLFEVCPSHWMECEIRYLKSKRILKRTRLPWRTISGQRWKRDLGFV